MRSKAKGYVILLAIFGTTILAFGFPFLLSGGGPEKRDDIVLKPRYTSTATPIDRALTQGAFAMLFFTPTNLPVAPPSLAASPTLELLIPVAGGNTITPLPSFTATLPTNTSQSVPPTPTRRRADDPIPTPTKTLAPVPTATTRPTDTARPTSTPRPTNTPRPSNTPEPSNTPKPTNTPKPSDTPEPTAQPTNPPDTPVPPSTDTPEPLPDTPVPTSDAAATETE